VVDGALVVAVPAVPVASALAALLTRSVRQADAVGRIGALLTALVAAVVAVSALADPADPTRGGWSVVDAATGAFLAVGAAVGLLAAAVSPAQLDGDGRRLTRALPARRRYWAAFLLFWAALLAVAVVDNLAVAWLLIEATTAASALLVAFSGRRRALEAGWKYLLLTSFGLVVALAGIVVLAAAIPDGASLAALDYAAIGRAAGGLEREPAALAFLLIVAGLAAKVGWAPVHHWLPDAHSEAPPAVSALLSAALLPTVALVVWRVQATLGPALADGAAGAVLIGLGLASLAFAVPFLWRPLALKRLLAYSSLEHMGVVALGIGIGHPWAIAGVLLHVAGHALAKTLGFVAAIPLLRHVPDAHHAPARGLARANPATATAVGVSLATLAAVPPSPLFLSELLILAGAFAAGEAAVGIVAAILLALGFLGLAHAFLETLLGEDGAPRWPAGRWSRRLGLVTAVVVVGLLALTAAGTQLPGSDPVELVMAGVLR